MQNNDGWIRQQIALGWIASLLILSLTLGTMLLQGLLSDAALLALSSDPGQHGLNFIKWVAGVYVLMAIGVYSLDARRRWIRWLFVAVSIVMLLLFVLHHLSHWVFGQRPDLLSHVMDVHHHVAMGWVVYNSVRWVRALPTAS